MLAVITVTFNCAERLDTTLDCVSGLRNHFKLQHIVIDGRSSDDTLKKIGSSNPEVLISEADNGIYDAMNKGISLVDEEVSAVVILHAGDQLYLEKFIPIMEDFLMSDAGILAGSMLEVDETSGVEILHWRSQHELTLVNPAVKHPAVFVKKWVYDELGCFDLDFRISSDFHFLCRALRHGVVVDHTDDVVSIVEPFGFSADWRRFVEKKVEHLRIVGIFTSGLTLFCARVKIVFALWAGILSMVKRRVI